MKKHILNAKTALERAIIDASGMESDVPRSRYSGAPAQLQNHRRGSLRTNRAKKQK